MIHHLYSNQCHDEAEVWCGVEPYWVRDKSDAVNHVDKTTCEECLRAVEQLGTKATRRLLRLKEGEL